MKCLANFSFTLCTLQNLELIDVTMAIRPAKKFPRDALRQVDLWFARAFSRMNIYDAGNWPATGQEKEHIFLAYDRPHPLPIPLNTLRFW